jgi:ubiquinone/menaquinone biosynthesis C-methylase UbiE
VTEEPAAGSATGSIRDAYNTVAAAYARVLADVSFESPLDLAMIRQFADALPTGAAEGGILDAGCGSGRMISHLESLGLRDVEGVDLSEAMIAQARISNPHHRFTIGDIAALPYPDKCFRGVLAWYSVIHTPAEQLPSVITELARVTQPGGYVLVGFQAGKGHRTIHRAYGHDVTLTACLHDPAATAELFTRQGFTISALLTREPRSSETHQQAFILARRSV